MTRILAIDPGAKHCGVASFLNGMSVAAAVISPDQLYGLVINRLEQKKVDTIVVERFQLYTGHAFNQEANDTVGCIEIVKFLARAYEIPVIEQGANIKVPLRAIVTARKLPRKAIDNPNIPAKLRTHADDAELHGYRYILKQQEEANQPPKRQRKTK